MTLPPKPEFKTIEDAKKWAEDFITFFEKFYADLYNESNETDKIAVKGNDNTVLHGFFGNRADME